MLRFLPQKLLGCASALSGVAAAALAGLIGFGVWSGTSGGERFIAHQIERMVSRSTVGGRLDIGALEIGRSGIRVDELALLDASDRALISAGRVTVELDGWSLLRGVVLLPRVRAEGVAIDLVADEHGVLDLSRLFGGPSEAPTSDRPFELPLPIRAPWIELRGVNVRYDRRSVVTPGASPIQRTAVELAGLEGRLSFDGRGDRLAFSDLVLAAQVAVPGPLGVRAHGSVVWDGSEGLLLDDVILEVPHGRLAADGTIGERTDVGLTVDRLEMRALDPVAGDAGLGGVWSATLTAAGDREVYGWAAELRGLDASAGRIGLSGTLDRSEAVPTWTLGADLDGFHVEDIYTPLGQPVVLGGRIEAIGQGLSAADGLAIDGRWQGGAQSLYGQELDSVDTRFTLVDGVLSLIDGRVDGVIGALRLDGTVDLLRGPVAIRASGDLSPERLAELGVSGLDGRGTVSVDIALDLKADPVVVEVNGEAKYAPFLYPNVRMEALSAPFWASVESGAVRGTVGLYGAGIEASGLTAASLEADALRLEVDSARRTTVSGPLRLERIAYDPYIGADRGDVALEVRLAGGHLSVDAAVAVGEHTLVGRPGTDGKVGIALRDSALTYDVALFDLGRQVLDTRGTFDLARSEVVLDSVAYAPTPRTTWVTAHPARMTLIDGGITDADLLVRSDLGELEVKGTLGTRGALDGTVAVRGFQIDHLAELYPDGFDGLSGALDLSLGLSGDASDPTVAGELDLERLFVDGSVRWLDVSGPIRLEGHALSPALRIGVAGRDLGRVSGTIPMSGGLADLAVDFDAPADLSLALVPGDFERLVRVSPSLEGTELPPGRISAVIEATETLRDPMLRLAGVAEVEVAGWTQPGRAEFDLNRRASELGFEVDLREGLATRGLVVGSGATRLGEAIHWAIEGGSAPEWGDLELYLDRMEVSLAMVGMPASSLGAAVSSPVPLTGDLVGGLVVTGSPSRPVIDGGLNWIDPTVDGQPLEGAYLALSPREKGYDLDLSIGFEGGPTSGAQIEGEAGGRLEVKGAVPVVVDLDREWTDWSTGALGLEVSGDRIPLALLSAVNPALRGGEGSVDISGTVGGTISDPAPELLASGQAGRLSHEGLGITASDISFQLEVDAKRIRLDHLDFTTLPSYRFQAGRLLEERPQVHVAGSAQLEDWYPSALSAKVELTRGPWLSATESVTVRADGGLMVSGAWPALSVTGDLDLVHGRVVLDSAALTEAAPLETDRNLRIVRGEVRPPPPPVEEPSLISDFDVAVTVDLKRSLELSLAMPFLEDLGKVGAAVSRLDLTSRLGGELDVRMQEGEPTLVGEVDIVEGEVSLLQSRFQMKDGTITFAGGDPSTDANLDLEAQMVVSGATVGMRITGTPEKPEITLHSDEYPDQTQQMAILLTGQLPEDLTAKNGAAASQALAGVLFNSLLGGRALGTFSVEPDGSVRVGVPVAPNVYAASTVNPLTTDPNKNAITLEGEWTVAPKVVVSGGIGDQISWGDVYWEIRF